MAGEALAIEECRVVMMRIHMRIVACDAMDGAVALLKAGAHLQTYGLEARGNRVVEIYPWGRLRSMAFTAERNYILAGKLAQVADMEVRGMPLDSLDVRGSRTVASFTGDAGYNGIEIRPGGSLAHLGGMAVQTLKRDSRGKR